jgi:hypothetical protein
MEWHASSTLSQTVYTFLFVHHLDDIDPEFIFCDPLQNEDPLRPLELITVVLRSAVLGMLKCCDLAWRELFKGGLQDVRMVYFDKRCGFLIATLNYLGRGLARRKV